MDGPGQVLDAVAPVTTTAVVVATVPATGLNMATSVALAVMAGLIVWGLLYIYHAKHKKAD